MYLCPTQPSSLQLMLLPAADGKESKEGQARQPTGWDKGNLVGKAKATHASKAKGGVDSLLPTVVQLPGPSPGRPGSIMHNGDFEIEMP